MNNTIRRRRLIRWGALAAVAVALVVVIAALAADDSGNESSDLAFNGVPLPAFTGSGTDEAVGLKAPLFVTNDLDGNRTVVGGGGGPNDTAKIVVFVAHWCPTCQRELPELTEWLAANDLPNDVEIVVVSTFEDAQRGNHPPKAWVEAVGWPEPVMVDSGGGEIAAAFGMSSVPSWVVLDNTNFVMVRGTGPVAGSSLDYLVELAASGS
ncbi:MAG: TlpA family protein disulfide reductase [Acidimicrobiales bacterium]